MATASRPKRSASQLRPVADRDAVRARSLGIGRYRLDPADDFVLDLPRRNERLRNLDRLLDGDEARQFLGRGGFPLDAVDGRDPVRIGPRVGHGAQR